MAKIAIVTDGNSDISEARASDLKVNVVSEYIKVGHETFALRNIKPEQLWERIIEKGSRVKVELKPAKPADLVEIYEKVKEEGCKTVFSIHTSSKLTNTIISANIAKGMIDGVDIRIIDSLGISASLLAGIMKANSLIKEKKSIDEIEAELNDFTASLNPFFISEGVEKWVRPARVKSRGLLHKLAFGKIAVLTLSNGNLQVKESHRNFSNAINNILNHVSQVKKKYSKFNYLITYSKNLANAKDLDKQMKKKFPKSTGKIVKTSAGISAMTSQNILGLVSFKL